ncbi:MAG: hypothetical protein MJ180_00540 [Candidatus Gastranaerophilales bacterium]|nr:hypothetical protein [Candidatus Gastranaerophilales bacterium]
MTDNVIEIINNDYIVEIEEASYTIETGDISICNYEHMPNKPKINSVELVGNKTSSDLQLASETDMVLKEDISNKVITINAASTDEQYASAKCVYTGLLSKSNIDLSNLSEIGQAVLNSKVPNTRTVNGQPLSADVVIDTTNSFSDITGQPNDNQNLATVLSTKQDTLVSGTNIKTVNNTSLLGSGNIELGSSVPDATESTKGIMKLYSSIGNNTDGTITQSAISISLSTKQDALVSGTNIKTINNNSLLGSGNISISASLSSAGSSTTPIYINSSGTPTACSYSLGSLASHNYQTSYSSVSSTSHSVVIKEYISGTSGYRIWSTGYCKQWGKITRASNDPVITITFLKTFKDANYSVSKNFEWSTNQSAFYDYICCYNKTASGFKTRNNKTYDATWCASGYLASGQY